MTAKTAFRDVTHQQRMEDILFMAETGESATGAARRLGITPVALEAWARRHMDRDTWLRMLARDPRDEAYRMRRAAR